MTHHVCVGRIDDWASDIHNNFDLDSSVERHRRSTSSSYLICRSRTAFGQLLFLIERHEEVQGVIPT